MSQKFRTYAYVVQNERDASSGVSVLISFARVSIVSVNSPFLQSHRQRKMAARFFPGTIERSPNVMFVHNMVTVWFLYGDIQASNKIVDIP